MASMLNINTLTDNVYKSGKINGILMDSSISIVRKNDEENKTIVPSIGLVDEKVANATTQYFEGSIQSINYATVEYIDSDEEQLSQEFILTESSPEEDYTYDRIAVKTEDRQYKLFEYSHETKTYTQINQENTVSIDDENIKNRSETFNEVVGRVTSGYNVRGGSTLVIKTPIENTTDKFSYTAYTYDTTSNENGIWKAMDGNYSADNVYFDKDILATVNLGTYQKLSNGNQNIPTKGKSVFQVFEDLLSETKEGTVTKYPSATISSTTLKTTYEVGTKITSIPFTISKDVGTYSYGPATGVTFSDFSVNFKIDNTESGTKTKNNETDTFEFPDSGITVTDTSKFILSGTYSYSDGVLAKTNKGTTGSTHITGKTNVALGGGKTVTGVRYSYYGGFDTKLELTSDNIKTKLTSTTSALSDTVIKVGGKQRVVIAIPITIPNHEGSYRSISTDKTQLSKVLDENDSNANITGTFNYKKVIVKGAGSDQGVEYGVFYLDFASAHATDNFKITE